MDFYLFRKLTAKQRALALVLAELEENTPGTVNNISQTRRGKVSDARDDLVKSIKNAIDEGDDDFADRAENKKES